MRILLKKLLKEDDLQIKLIKSLYQTFFIIINLGNDIFVQSNVSLLVIYWRQYEVEELL